MRYYVGKLLGLFRRLFKRQIEVQILVDGGLVQGIWCNRKGVTALVLDYDVEGCDPEDLETDSEGNQFFLGRWNSLSSGSRYMYYDPCA